jgi:predicted hydrocarbon binding protein
MQGTAWLDVRGKPPTVQMVSAMTIRADPGGAACAFYAGALAELLREYTGHDHTVAHPRCQAPRRGCVRVDGGERKCVSA